MSDLQIKEWHKHVIFGACSLIMTLIAGTSIRNFVIYHPFISLMLVLLCIPLLIPISKFFFPQIRQMKFIGKYIPVIMLGIIAALFFLSLTSFFILALLLMLHALSSIVLRVFKRNNFGFELVLLITVLSGVAYGAKTGAIMGSIAMLMDYIFSGRLSIFSIITIPTYALIGMLSSTFSYINILTLGIALSIFYNLFTWIFIIGFMGGDISKCVRFGITNLLFNIFVFGAFAPTFLMIMR
jgi:hypothetical protein